MVQQNLVDILVRKITTGAINPKTGEPFKLEDILIPEYRDAVQAILTVV